MELLKDYNCTILYYPSKTNVVADALSCKSMGSLAQIVEVRRLLIEEIHGLETNGAKLEIKGPRLLLAYLKIRSILIYRIKNA